MVYNFNHITDTRVKEILEQSGCSPEEDELGDVADSALFYFYSFGPYVAPFNLGFFFKNLQRFEEPVPFKWPSGPIKPIFTRIVSGSRLDRQLKQIGL